MIKYDKTYPLYLIRAWLKVKMQYHKIGETVHQTDLSCVCERTF